MEGEPATAALGEEQRRQPTDSPVVRHRFTGTIDELCEIYIPHLVAWLRDIPEEEWHHLGDPAYRNWDAVFRPYAEALVANYYPGCRIGGMGLWLVEPGQVHPAHTDLQHDDWLVRLHIPLATNEHCLTRMRDGDHRMHVHKVYRFNTLAEHEVVNAGTTKRVHFVIDVFR